MRIMTQKLLNKQKTTSNNFRKNTLAEAITIAMFASVVSTPVFAADANERQEEKIIVTATKSAEAIQEVPLAITALTGEFMEEAHLDDIKDLIAYTPGITGNSTDSFLDAISVRGIRTDDYGAGGDLSNAVFKNDLYEGRTGSAVSTLFDMDRAEVVRGPQGFLFGRNAIGGAISSHTRKAEIDISEGYLDLEIAEYNKIKVEAGINIPINDNFAMRFAGVYHTEDPYITNLFPGNPIPDTDTKAIRWSTTYNDTGLNIYTMVEYENRDRPSTQYRPVTEGPAYEEFMAVYGDWALPDGTTLNQNGGIRGGIYDIDTDAQWGLHDIGENLNLQLRLEKDLGFADLTVSAGFKDHKYFYSEDWEATPIQLGSWKNDQSGDYSQIEARLNDKSDGPLGWYLGASYYKEDLDVKVSGTVDQEHLCQYYGYAYYGFDAYYAGMGCADLYPLNYYGVDLSATDQLMLETSHVLSKNTGWAAYLNLDYQITDTVDAEIGIRHSSDTKDLSNSFTSSGSVFHGYPDWFEWMGFYLFGATTAEPVRSEKTWSKTTGKALVRWRPTDDMMMYYGFTQGYKSGGFTTSGLEYSDGTGVWGDLNATNDGYQIPSFGEENVDSHEFGYKDTWFDDTDVSIIYFSYEYTGLQVNSFDEESGSTVIRNIGNVEASGIEISGNTSLSDNWKLYFQMSTLDSEATGIQDQCFYQATEDACEGSKLYWAPEWSGSLVLNGDFPLDNGALLRTSVSTYWEDEHSGGFDFIEESIIPFSQTWSVMVGYESASNWYIQAYVDNVTDEINWDSSYNGAFNSAYGGSYPHVRWSVTKPRTFGIRMGLTWE